MNKKGEWGTIPSKNDLIGLIVILAIAFVIFAIVLPQANRLINPPIEEQIVKELRTEITGITSGLDSIRTSIGLLNENINSKASESSVNELNSQVKELNGNLENTTKRLDYLNTRVDDIEETIKLIEPSYVQNIDTRDFRTYINIFNLRLVMNFFFAITFSLLAIEIGKLFTDMIVFNYTHNQLDLRKWSIRAYFKQKSVKKNQITINQETEIHQNRPKQGDNN